MHTGKEIPSFGNKVLPPGCPQLKSLLIDHAIRGAGKRLYEILGMAELMRVAYEKGELESLQERLAVLLSEAGSLSVALSNIRELVRLETETGEPSFREFDTVALLREVTQTARVVAGEKPVTIMDAASPVHVIVRSDPQKIRRIMTELVTNAAKFTDRGRIALIFNKDDDCLRLMVTDTGKGMNPEEIAFLYADEHEFDGEIRSEISGTGLRIAGHLLKSLDGSISVSSKIGKGTIVEVMLPLISAASRNAALTGRETSSGRNRRRLFTPWPQHGPRF